MILPGFLYAKKMHSLSPMNLLIDSKLQVQTKTGKYNVGFVHLGAENPKLLNFVFQRFD